MNYGDDAFFQGAPRSEKLRFIANYLDMVDSSLRIFADAFPAATRDTQGVPLAQFVYSTDTQVQDELREWADDLDVGFLLHNGARDPMMVPKNPGT